MAEHRRTTGAPTIDPRDLDLFERILRHEERTGFQDTSTSLGLARFFNERAQTVAEQQRRPVERLAALFADYRDLSELQRRARVDACRRALAELRAGCAAPDPTAVQQPSTAPAANRQEMPPGLQSTQPARKVVDRRPRVGALSDSVRLLPGVGEGRARQLELLGVRTIRDLLHLYPRRHIDYSNVEKIRDLWFGRVSTIQGTVETVEESRTRTGKTLVTVAVRDETGVIHATWFNPYVAKQLQPGTRVSLSGRVEHMRGSLVLNSPEWELLESDLLSTGRLTPVYPLTKNLYQKTLRPIVRAGLDVGLPLVEEFLPADMREEEGLLGLRDALAWVHFPEGATAAEAQRNLRRAQQRLAFDEFLTLQLGLLRRKRAWQAQPGHAMPVDHEAVGRFVRALPFTLTRAQRRALREILEGLADPRPMTRMLQGDVGSGKTVVAAAAMIAAIRAGYQTALMAPTEILAEQHAHGFERLFAALPPHDRPRLGFLTGSTSGRERQTVLAGVQDGSIDLLIGTHALIQLGVEYANLGFVVIDEQHRFGVEQRAALRNKGLHPDVLVMTATPIPRTLALTLHGDLDVSTLDELPPGRQPIVTRWMTGRQRREAYQFIRDEIARGRQAFVIVPLVEESEAVDAKAAVAEYERLKRDVFPDLPVGLLHGRLKPAEKEAVMTAFRDGDVSVLVATSVVEVGIDVPNATVMMVDGADRFGLAQLHQFRGRVGRGAEQSYCLLVADDVSQEGRRRLESLVDSQDGFYLAQVDLELRGPGDYLGTRQSGLPEMQFSAFADVRDLERARSLAERILSEDPDLAGAQYARLRARVEAFWADSVADVS
ncbi:MAG: DNA helicase RecG [Chloroflexi bacterium]|nr:MAG: DNA helicase RecG [Chloroflexota bacterium]